MYAEWREKPRAARARGRGGRRCVTGSTVPLKTMRATRLSSIANAIRLILKWNVINIITRIVPAFRNVMAITLSLDYHSQSGII